MFFKSKKIQILCIGSAARDIFFPLEYMQTIDTPEDILSQKKAVFELGAKYKTDDIYDAPGGGAVNIASGLAQFGIISGIASFVGDDRSGKSIRDFLKEKGVDTNCLRVERNTKTDVSCILVNTKDGERIIFYNRDANETPNIEKKDIKMAEGIMLSSLSGNWEHQVDMIVEKIAQQKKKLFYNPGQKNIEKKYSATEKLIRASEILFVNKDEAIGIIKQSSPQIIDEKLNNEEFLLQELLHLGSKYVVITDGERGAWASSQRNNVIYKKPEKVECVVDRTGAGDAFISGFLSAYAEELSLEDCTQRGVANGRSVVCYYGAHKGLLKKEKGF